MRPFDHVCGGGSETCALRMRCLAGIVVLPPGMGAEAHARPLPYHHGAKTPHPEGEGKELWDIMHSCRTRVHNTVQLGMAVDRRPPYSVLRGPWDLSHRKWIVAPFLRRTRYPSPRPSLTTSATPNDSPTV